MRACICDACGKVQPMKYYGLPAHWISVEQRGDPPGVPIDPHEPEEAYPKIVFEAVCCSWECVAKLAQQQATRPA